MTATPRRLRRWPGKVPGHWQVVVRGEVIGDVAGHWSPELERTIWTGVSLDQTTWHDMIKRAKAVAAIVEHANRHRAVGVTDAADWPVEPPAAVCSGCSDLADGSWRAAAECPLAALDLDEHGELPPAGAWPDQEPE